MPPNYNVPIPKVAGPLDRYQNVLALQQMQTQGQANTFALQQAQEDAARQAAFRNALAQDYATPEERTAALTAADPVAASELLGQEADRRLRQTEAENAAARLGIDSDQLKILQSEDVSRRMLETIQIARSRPEEDQRLGIFKRRLPEMVDMFDEKTEVTDEALDSVLMQILGGPDLPALIQELEYVYPGFSNLPSDQKVAKLKEFTEATKTPGTTVNVNTGVGAPGVSAYVAGLSTGALDITSVPAEIRGVVLQEMQRQGKEIVTTSQASEQRQAGKTQPILDEIRTLSERINTAQGPAAIAQGLMRQGAASVNLDDDVARYQDLVEGFVPLVARALGHTGVLTEQDVASTRALFPQPGESRSLAEGKLDMIERIMSGVGESIGQGKSLTGTEPDAGFKVGDIVEQDGKRYRVTSVEPFEGEELP